MKVKYLFLSVLSVLLVFLLLPGVALAEERSLSISGFFTGAYDYSEVANEEDVTFDDNSFQVAKARLNIEFKTEKVSVPLKLFFRGDMETGSFVSKELSLRALLKDDEDTKIRFLIGLLATPCIAIHPPPELIETYDFPLSSAGGTLEEVGVRFDFDFKQFEFKAAVVNGNHRKCRDDDKNKNFHLRLGWHPSWGMARGFYMRELGGSDTLYGTRLEVRFPWNMKMRGSGLIRDYGKETFVEKKWGWNILVCQEVSSRIQLLVQYEQYDDGIDHTTFNRVEKVTGGINTVLWNFANLGINYWQNTTGPDEWGIITFLSLSMDPMDPLTIL